MVSTRELGDDTQGDCDFEALEIRILKTLPKPLKELTLFHEIFHIIDMELDHDLVELLSSNIYHVLVENKLLRQ